MLRDPFGGVAIIPDVDLPAVRMIQPQEWAAVAGLATPVELDGIVRDRRPEVRTPFGLAVVTVGARVSQRKGPPSLDWLRPASSTVLCAIVDRKYDRHSGSSW